MVVPSELWESPFLLSVSCVVVSVAWKCCYDCVFADTSDVQTAQVVFYENNVFLSCSFADDSSASGCVFTFQVNQNGTGNEQFVLLQSVGGQQCNTTDNQQNGYTEISVQDLEDVVMDQLSLGQLSLLAEVTVLDSAADYSQQTGCSVPTGMLVLSDALRFHACITCMPVPQYKLFVVSCRTMTLLLHYDVPSCQHPVL